MLGIQLPGSYNFSALKTINKIMTVADSPTPNIFSSIGRQIDELVTTAITLANNGESNTVTTSPTRDTIELLQNIRGDLRGRRSDVETSQALENIKGMPYLPNCKKLAGFLED